MAALDDAHRLISLLKKKRGRGNQLASRRLGKVRMIGSSEITSNNKEELKTQISRGGDTIQ